MQKKKVLIFIDWFLPGYKAGGPIQSVANLIDHLKEEFDFSVITRDTDYCETTPYGSVISDAWNLREDGVRVYYFSKEKLNRTNLRTLIRKTDFDIVYLNGIYSLYFTLIPLVLLRKKHGKKIIIASRGMFAQSALGVKKTKKQFFLRAVKIIKLFDSTIFHATNDLEKDDIRIALGNRVAVRTAANLPQKYLKQSYHHREKMQGGVRLVNVARISPEKNLLQALKILKEVRVNVIFDFYGPVYDQEYWNQCKEVLDTLPSNITARYRGSLENTKVMDTLKQYHFMFMPTLGENFGHIIFQSLSAGCPVIISDQTPWKNLEPLFLGWDISLQDTNSFVAAIEDASKMSQEDYEKMSKAAYGFALQYMDDSKVLEQNRALFS